MVARAVAFVEMPVAAKMQQVQLVNQAVALQQIQRAIDGDAGNARIELLSALQYFVGIEVAAGRVHDLQQDATLPCEADAASAELAFEMAG